MKMSTQKLSVLFVGLVLSVTAQAAIIPINTLTEMAVGDGVDPVTGARFNPCVEFDPKDVSSEDFTNSDDFSSVRTKLDVEEITTHEDLDRYMSASISGSVSYYGSGGNFSYSQKDQYTLHSDQASLGITLSADYGRWYLNNVKLKPAMAKLAKNDPDKFYKLCGKEYVAGYSQGQGVRMLMMTSQNSTYTYHEIQASLHAAYNGGVTSGSLDASYSSIASQLIKNGMLTIHYFSYGSGPMSTTDVLISNKADVEAYRTTVANLAKAMTTKQAVKSQYITRTYPGVVGNYDPIFAENQRQVFDILYSDYRQLADTQLRLGATMGKDFANFANQDCTQDYQQYCVEYVDSLNKLAGDIQKSIAIVDKLAKQCAVAKVISDCRIPTVQEVNLGELNKVQWPMQFRYALYLQMLKDIRDRHNNQTPGDFGN